MVKPKDYGSYCDTDDPLQPICDYHGQVNQFDKPHGIGRLWYKDYGYLYEGQFVNGKPNGFCRIIESYDAVHYRGYVKDFLRHGQGKMFEYIKHQYDGVWHNDKLLDQQYYKALYMNKNETKEEPDVIKVVRLHALGENSGQMCQEFIQINHPLFKSVKFKCPVPSQLVGYELVMTRAYYKPHTDVSKINQSSNVIGTRMTIDRQSGFAPPEFTSCLGPTYVYRADL